MALAGTCRYSSLGMYWGWGKGAGGAGPADDAGDEEIWLAAVAHDLTREKFQQSGGHKRKQRVEFGRSEM